MLTPAALILATTVSLMPNTGSSVPRRIDVDCTTRHALERALAKTQQLAEVQIYLDGVCTGNYVIARDGITLRGATEESGIAGPAGDSSSLPVLEVIDARVVLSGMVVRGGSIGVLSHGWKSDVQLLQVDVQGQTEVGVYVRRGGRARLFNAEVRDGSTGVAADSSTTLFLQHVVVSNQHVGVVVSDRSFAALTDTTIENCSGGGLNVVARSDANVIRSTFHENGEVHVNANDFSSIKLLSGVTIGSEADTTPFSLTANRGASITAFSTPAIYGNVGAVDRGAIRLGNTVLNGDLLVIEFANAHVRSSEITGSVVCLEGADAICSQTPTAGAFGCGSTTCGSAPAESFGVAPPVSELPAVDAPRFERQLGSRTRR